MEFKRSPDLSVNHISDECVVLDGSDGGCHVLSETAGWLLSIADDFVRVERASQLAEERYEIAPGVNVEGEIVRVLDEMAARLLVELRH